MRIVVGKMAAAARDLVLATTRPQDRSRLVRYFTHKYTFGW
jgi:hypothetical protein